MKKNNTLLGIIAMFISITANCQHQLYFETFNGLTNTFTLNDNQLGINAGNNKWTVDTNYFGGGIYPKSTNENLTYGGTISGAPYSQYLHIYDSASTYLDDNYNPTDSSTRFAHMTTGICTKSLTNINFNFYYMCQGSATAYGQAYYSIDGGAWLPTGSILNNRYKWQYATITNPAFTNVEDLRFGFLWHNNKAAGHDTSGLGIDDVSIYGTYDSVAHPITCKFTTMLLDSCLGGSPYVYFQAAISDSTCNAAWNMYMSNDVGGFPGPFAWTQNIGISYFNDSVSYWYLTIPNSYNTVGHCYHFKMQRNTYPFLTFVDSFCFPFDSCPGFITALQPPATLDTNPVCAGSVIDIPFTSTGVYHAGNIYYAQLIDSTRHTRVNIGSLASSSAFVYPTVGDIVGTIPLSADTGCYYYIRVVCTTPDRGPIIWGPFCIQHCDVLTNSQQSMQVCLGSCYRQPHGYYDTITYNTHEFDHRAKYFNGNKFKVQLIQYQLYPPYFSAINTGLLGGIIDTTSGKLLLHVPCPDTLNVNGIYPGNYYMRIIADSSSFSDSSLGTLVQLTIGEPADSLILTYLPATGPYCAGTIINFYANPSNFSSTYLWSLINIHGTSPFVGYTADPLNLNLAVGTIPFLISCQENNYGCLGPKATIPDSIVVLGPPNISKTGPLILCEGDTGTYSIPFAGSTNYLWRLPAHAHSDTANNKLKISFDTTGTFRVSVEAFNACFTDSAVWTIHVKADSVCTLSVNNISARPSVTVYPNPNKGQFTIQSFGANGALSVEVYNILGEEIFTENVSSASGNNTINMTSQPNGIYLYRVISETGGLIGQGKLIIQK